MVLGNSFIIESNYSSRNNPFSLIVALNNLNESQPSFGSLFWDDGESIG